MVGRWSSGIDIGGTKTLIIAKDDKGTILKENYFKTKPERGFEEVFSEIKKNISDFSEALKSPPQAIGIGIAGQIDKAKGELIRGPNLHWENVPIRELLNKAFHCPIHVLNDVRAATLGEWLYGAGQKVANLACIFVGTGIGGGFIIEGKLYEGANNSAGEIGHMIVSLNGPKCTCGNSGCVEAFAGGWALAKRAQDLAAENPSQGKKLLEMAKGDLQAIDGKIVIQAFHENDGIARTVIHKAKEALTAGVLSIIHAINPELIIFGGGIVDAMPKIFVEVESDVRKTALGAAVKNLTFKKAFLEKKAVALGATASLN